MSATEQPPELVRQLASELTRCRQRGLEGIDKEARNQPRVKAAELERLAHQYCQAKDLKLHGRIAHISRLLRDGLDAYIQRGCDSDGTFIKELFFGDDTSGAHAKNAGQLLDDALLRRRQSEQWFASRRRNLFEGLAAFLVTFVTDTVTTTTPDTAPDTTLAAAPDATPIPAPAPSGRTQPKTARIAIMAALAAVLLTGTGTLWWFTTRDSNRASTQHPASRHSPIGLPAHAGKTYLETVASGKGAATYTDPYSVDTTGLRVEFLHQVQVSCKVYSPVMPSVGPQGYWYRIASPPWNNHYYAPANSFANGDPPHGPYTDKDIDESVPDCPTNP